MAAYLKTRVGLFARLSSSVLTPPRNYLVNGDNDGALLSCQAWLISVLPLQDAQARGSVEFCWCRCSGPRFCCRRFCCRRSCWCRSWFPQSGAALGLPEQRRQVPAWEPSVITLKSNLLVSPLPEYTERYGTRPVWADYRRNHKGAIPPQKTRRTCIVNELGPTCRISLALT